MRPKKLPFGVLINFLFLLFVNMDSSYAENLFELGPNNTKIKGSIKYTVIGKYHSDFKQFRGFIEYDEKTNLIESVDLDIESKSITSNCQWCDKIVKSKQLLYTEKYPKIIFKSNEIVKSQQGYIVKGMLDLHGQRKEIEFPFNAKITVDRSSGKRMLKAKGKWIINRKDYNIIWNKLLDKGGILVGNYITVDWGINTAINDRKDGL